MDRGRRDRAVDLRIRFLAARRAAGGAERGGGERLPLRRGRRALHPGDHGRAGRARVHLAARTGLGRALGLPPHGVGAGTSLRGRREGRRRQRHVPRRGVRRPWAGDRPRAVPRPRRRRRVQPGDGRRGRGRRRGRRRSRALHVDPSRLLRAGVHARRARSHRAASLAASCTDADPGRRRGQPRRRSSPRAKPVRISSSRAVPCSGATIRQRPTASSRKMVADG